MVCLELRETKVKKCFRRAKTRWRIERDYRELKHSLGLAHSEDRTRRHHVTFVTAAQTFSALLRYDPNPRTTA